MDSKKKYIIGNWKSNKTSSEVESWFKTIKGFYEKDNSIKLDNLEIVVCPPFIHIPAAKKLLDTLALPIKLGAQNVSPFGFGAYTGEVSAIQLSEYVQYVIIGHSERRFSFAENDEILAKKVDQARAAKLQTIFCVPDEKTAVPRSVEIVAYEPVWAIGTGKTENPQHASEIAKSIKTTYKIDNVIYGGSVKADNIKSFLTTQDIDGVLPGAASLDPSTFWEMIKSATVSY